MFSQLDPPALNCLSVDATGNVIVNWEQPADPNGIFNNYHIFWADANNFNGPYQEIILDQYSTTSYVHTGANADVISHCYYLVTESFDGTNVFFSEPSDTLCTIFLTALPSVGPEGFAELSWTTPYPFGPPQAGMQYEIWVEFPVGIWNQVAETSYDIMEYSQEISICDEYLNFQILLTAPDGCVFTSNVDGDQFVDVTPPDIPVVTGVTVLDNGDALVSWEPSNAPDTQGYIVYSCTNNIVTLIDSVFGATTFTDILANTAAGPVSYLVAAFDTCYSGDPPSPNTSPTGNVCNTSIHLTNLPYLLCEDQVTINWTPYIGWQAGVDHFDIWYSSDGVNYNLIETVPGSQLSYNHVGFLPGASAYYFVRGWDWTGAYSVDSRKINISVAYPAAPQNIYLATATVTGPHHVSVLINMQPSIYQHYFKLERLEDGDDDWEEVLTQSGANVTNLIYFDSLDVKPSVFSYTYRLIVRNGCEDIVDTTNIGKTILLDGVANESRQVNTMVWNAYEGWEEGVAGYNIYRRIGFMGSLDFLTSVGSSASFYEDDVSPLFYTEGEFCYVIEAVEEPNSMGGTSSAFSNEVCVTQPPKIWVPNAFIPGGYNSIFKPVITFADIASYEMYVFSNWGDIIFTTNDIEIGWDGTMNGSMVQEGAYPYHINIKDGRGHLYEQVGTVTMLNGEK